MRILSALLIVLAGFALVPGVANSYVLENAMWRAMPVTYCVNPEGTPTVDGAPIISAEDFVKTVDAAFKQWQDDPNSNLRFISNGLCDAPFHKDGINVVTWFRQPIDQGGETYLALSQGKYLRGGAAKEILESDIALNPRDERMPNNLDAYLHTIMPYVLLHEIGHFIGLEHNTEACSVMVPRRPNTTLCPDDLAGAGLLYP